MNSLFLIAIALSSLGQDAQERYEAQVVASKPAAIASAEAELKSLLAIKPKPDRKKYADAAISETRKRLAGLKNGTALPVLRLNLSKPQVGSFGIIPATVFVTQVIDDNNLLANVMWYSGNELVQRIHWIELDSTKGIADKTEYEAVATVFEAVGTKKYDTVAGSSSTVWHLRQLAPKRPVMP